MFGDALNFGTAWFWSLTIFFIFFVIGTINKKEPGLGFGILLYLGALYLWGDFNPFPWMFAHPMEIFALAFLYVIAGTTWAVVKWRLFVKAKAHDCNRFKLEYQPGEGVKDLHGYLLDRTGLSSLPPLVYDEKSRITRWMMWWPISLILTLIDDPIQKIFTAIYDFIAKRLQSISDKAFKDL